MLCTANRDWSANGTVRFLQEEEEQRQYNTGKKCNTSPTPQAMASFDHEYSAKSYDEQSYGKEITEPCPPLSGIVMQTGECTENRTARELFVLGFLLLQVDH